MPEHRERDERNKPRNDQRRGESRKPQGDRPWRICLIRSYTNRAGDEKTDFVRIGAAFPNKNAEGFSGEIYVPLEANMRIALFPPDDSET